MKQVVVIIICLFTSSVLFAQTKEKTNEGDKIQEAYIKANKKSIDTAKPMIDFFLKYDEKDSLHAPNQVDFDQMLNEMGLMDEIKNDKSGLTKEDAFQFINAYINADDNIGKEKPAQPNSNTESELQKELKKAEELLENAMPEMEKWMKEAEKEAEKMNLNPNIISYDDFRKRAKEKQPDLSESEIRDAYNEMIKSFE
ncbi:hypothetical protein BZG02_02015 [Labilibaculum filiforme]|uniref:EF-hand domain-containing protein n=1 Tax=Labilibaculum filiforme TaxID=1940526 RepID=A0A2N3I655_9BACT|nr:hypothetical protein [Labilibaculum filiforme]PKQ65804.1 hypothetical protein BZG02_02015 [Labilibaculum filiforme]